MSTIVLRPRLWRETPGPSSWLLRRGDCDITDRTNPDFVSGAVDPVTPGSRLFIFFQEKVLHAFETKGGRSN